MVESQRAISHIRWSRQHGQGSSSCRFLNALVRISIFILRATRSSVQSLEYSPLHYGGALLNGIREACQNFTGIFTRDKVRWPCIQPKDQFLVIPSGKWTLSSAYLRCKEYSLTSISNVWYNKHSKSSQRALVEIFFPIVMKIFREKFFFFRMII